MPRAGTGEASSKCESSYQQQHRTPPPPLTACTEGDTWDMPGGVNCIPEINCTCFHFPLLWLPEHSESPLCPHMWPTWPEHWTISCSRRWGQSRAPSTLIPRQRSRRLTKSGPVLTHYGSRPCPAHQQLLDTCLLLKASREKNQLPAHPTVGTPRLGIPRAASPRVSGGRPTLAGPRSGGRLTALLLGRSTASPAHPVSGHNVGAEDATHPGSPEPYFKHQLPRKGLDPCSWR